MGGSIRKHTFGHVYPCKIQTSLFICADWSESFLGKFRFPRMQSFFMQRTKTDQTVCRLIWVFIGCTCHKVHFLMWWSQCLQCACLQGAWAGLGGSVGCAVRLETRPRSVTFFRGHWSWNIFYGHSLPSSDSRRAVVSFWRKNVHNTG